VSAACKRTVSASAKLRDDRGNSLVEFAFVLPIFFMVVLASLTFLWVVAARSAISGAVRAGARYASIQHDWKDCPSTGTCYTGYPTQDEVLQYVKDKAGVFEVDSVTVDPSVSKSDPSTQPYRNQIITVKASRDIPTIFGPIAGLFGVDHVTYSSSSVARAE
jgi:hypothetical protein